MEVQDSSGVSNAVEDVSDSSFVIQLLKSVESPMLSLFENAGDSDDVPIALKNLIRRFELKVESALLDKYPDLSLKEAEDLFINSNPADVAVFVNANLCQFIIGKTLMKMNLTEEQKSAFAAMRESDSMAAKFLDHVQNAFVKENVSPVDVVKSIWNGEAEAPEIGNVVREVIEEIAKDKAKEVLEVAAAESRALQPDAPLVEAFLFSVDESALRPELKLLLNLYKSSALPTTLLSSIRMIEKSVELELHSKHPDLPLEQAREKLLKDDMDGLQDLIVKYFQEFVMSKFLDKIPLDTSLKVSLISQLNRLSSSKTGREFFIEVETRYRKESGLELSELVRLVAKGEGKEDLKILKNAVEESAKILFTNNLMLLAAREAKDHTGGGDFTLLISILRSLIQRDEKLQKLSDPKDMQFSSKAHTLELILNLVTNPDMPIPIRIMLRTLEMQIEAHILEKDPNFDVTKLDELLQEDHADELEAVFLNGFKNLLLTKVLEKLPIPEQFRQVIVSTIATNFTPEKIDHLLTRIAHLVSHREDIKDLMEGLLTGDNEKVMLNAKELIIEEFEEKADEIIDKIGDKLAAKLRKRAEEDDQTMCRIMCDSLFEAILGRMVGVALIIVSAIVFVVSLCGQILLHVFCMLTMWQWMFALDPLFLSIYATEIAFTTLQGGLAMLINPLIGIVGTVMGVLESASRASRYQHKLIGRLEKRKNKFDLDAYTDYVIASMFWLLKKSGLADGILNAIFDPAAEEEEQGSGDIRNGSHSEVKVHPDSAGMTGPTYQSDLNRVN